jgi:hypothetical protein
VADVHALEQLGYAYRSPYQHSDESVETAPILLISGEATWHLTQTGALRAHKAVNGLWEEASEASDAASNMPLLPCWNSVLRELRLGSRLVKRFQAPADNQEAILDALEEEGWPVRIDDPLSPTPDINAKRRLHDTIKNLNRHQTHRVIRFRGDGRGEGVLWEALPE